MFRWETVHWACKEKAGMSKLGNLDRSHGLIARRSNLNGTTGVRQCDQKGAIATLHNYSRLSRPFCCSYSSTLSGIAVDLPDRLHGLDRLATDIASFEVAATR